MNYHKTRKLLGGIALLLLTLVIACIAFLPVMCVASAEAVVESAEPLPSEPLTWEYLATVGGAAVFVLLFVQLTKSLIDKLWKIPTTLYAYVIAVVTMIVATAFTSGLTPSAVLLTLFNGWIVSATASKTYDAMTVKKEVE